MVVSGATLRLRAVLQDAGLSADAWPLLRVSSKVNEVWIVGEHVVRIGGGVTGSRLAHEARLAPLLPESARHPRIVAAGHLAFGDYLVSMRHNGMALAQAWPLLEERQRHDAMHQLGRMLADVHACDPRAADRELWGDGFLEDPVLCPYPFPYERFLRCLAYAKRQPALDHALLDAIAVRACELATAFDPADPPHLVHGDLHFENVLFEGGELALLDFEYSRPGPIDLDLDVLLRFCASPGLHASDDYAAIVRDEQFVSVPRWLREAYPALFGHPRLVERLTFYALAYDLRALVADPPRQHPAALPPHHPLHRLRSMVNGDVRINVA